jgi:predicted PolB exonuclease-like 3'-5' exonuclease
MKENNENTFIRINELSKSLKIDVKWECELRRELKEDKLMNDFFNDNGFEKGPIYPRSAYFGGRTGYGETNIFLYNKYLVHFHSMKKLIKLKLYQCMILFHCTPM